ncbi:MAG: DUF1566 domain-containing protein [Treponemataceae bacterium]|nr:DUF1566 domain-containing protein [Treponemataceae bacterium]
MKKISLLVAALCCALSASGQSRARSYAPGDIVLADGTLVKAGTLSALDTENLPIAVIAAVKKGGALGVGVHRSVECVRFEAQSADEETAPNFAAHYAAAHHIRGAHSEGWRLPGVEELKTIYANRAAVNASLQSMHRLDAGAAMGGLGSAWYWTGTPASVKKGCTWFVHFFNGYAGECERDMTNLNAIAVRTFGGE